MKHHQCDFGGRFGSIFTFISANPELLKIGLNAKIITPHEKRKRWMMRTKSFSLATNRLSTCKGERGGEVYYTVQSILLLSS